MKRWLTPLGALLMLVLVVMGIAGLWLVPPGAELPVQWDMAGHRDRFVSRDFALAWPIGVAAIAWAVVALIVTLAPPEMARGGIRLARAALVGLTAVFLVIESATVLLGMGLAVNMLQTIAFAIAALLVIMGGALPRSEPNGIAGIRIPTTLRDPENWRATHRFTGWLCIGAGIVLAVAASSAPTKLLVWFLVACITLPMLASTLYSRAYARRKPRI